MEKQDLTFKGTQGNWVMDCTNSSIRKNPKHLSIVNENGVQLALVNHSVDEISIDEYSANAKLIASAPDLLKVTIQAYVKLQAIANRHSLIAISTETERLDLRDAIAQSLGIDPETVQIYIENQAKKGMKILNKTK